MRFWERVATCVSGRIRDFITGEWQIPFDVDAPHSRAVPIRLLVRVRRIVGRGREHVIGCNEPREELFEARASVYQGAFDSFQTVRHDGPLPHSPECRLSSVVLGDVAREYPASVPVGG